MATAILKLLYDIEVVRTRDLSILGNLDIVYDVGDGEFDHHNIKLEYRENGTPYAACGLIWRKFGREAIQLKCPQLSPDKTVEVFRHIDLGILQEIVFETLF
ncbi:MAG: MYG1 family protein [Bacillota bacterium]